MGAGGGREKQDSFCEARKNLIRQFVKLKRKEKVGGGEGSPVQQRHHTSPQTSLREGHL